MADTNQPEKTAKPGRPPSDNPKIQRQIRATAEEWDRWRRAAGRAGETLSAWIRAAADRAAGSGQ